MSQRNGNNKSGRSMALAMSAIACVLAAAALGGCRGDRTAERPRQFFPDMDDQPKYKAQSENPVFADGRSMRTLVPGVVGFGSSTDANDPDRRWLVIDSDALAFGLTPDGGFVESMPMGEILGMDQDERVTPAAAERFVRLGQEKYGIFCLPCHGPAGDGKGVVGQRWQTILPSYHDARFQRGNENGEDGYIFHTIRNGLPNAPGALPLLKMPAYGDRVSVEEAWAIVAYVRALQKTQRGQPRDVPEVILDQLVLDKSAAQNNTAPEGSTP